MLIQDVPYLLALGAGFISFFSPCVIPMIPAYIMYLTGTTAEEELKDKRLLALTRTLNFVLGFTIIFMIMGASASFIGRIFIQNKKIFSKISGILIIFFGLSMMGLFNIRIFNKAGKFSAPRKISNWFSSILMGMAFAAGWSPCFGPTLGAILIYTGNTETLSKGIILLLIYSIGMGIPFILTALFIDKFIAFISKADKLLIYLPKVGGFIMIIFGVLVYFDKIINISRWML